MQATAPDAAGLRRVTERLAAGSLEDLRALAQSFTAQPKAVFVAALTQPPSVLAAASADAGFDAGKLLKAALAEAGGRGGGTPRIAQGSVPGAELLEAVLAKLCARVASVGAGRLQLCFFGTTPFFVVVLLAGAAPSLSSASI